MSTQKSTLAQKSTLLKKVLKKDSKKYFYSKKDFHSKITFLPHKSTCAKKILLKKYLYLKKFFFLLHKNIYLNSTQIVSSLLAVYISCDIIWNSVHEKGTVFSHQQDTQALKQLTPTFFLLQARLPGKDSG